MPEAQIKLGRHRCTVCAYAAGYEDGLAEARLVVVLGIAMNADETPSLCRSNDPPMILRSPTSSKATSSVSLSAPQVQSL